MQNLNAHRPNRRGQEGYALFLALSLLVLFVGIGSAYVRHMSLETLDGNRLLRESRARNLASAGIEAAVAQLQAGVVESTAQSLAGEHEFSFPTFGGIRTAGVLNAEPLEDSKATAVVTISDENAKINLNHAPASVLAEVLGVDSGTARDIAKKLPSSGFAETQWLFSVDGLAHRGLSPEAFAAINRAWVTTDTVLDHDAPANYINVNTIPPELLAIITGLPLDVAQTAAEQRPFANLDALHDATGKDPNTYRIRPDSFEQIPYSPALTTESRCFRIHSEGRYTAENGMSAQAAIEAVVLFDAAGGYRFARWNIEQAKAPAAETAPAEAAPTEETTTDA